MSSSRLPGKSLAPLVGKPLIWHVIHRLSKSETVDEIALATSDQPSDDSLADYVSGLGIRVIRGPLDDVLRRFVMAAEVTDADIVVRVTGDAVLVDPNVVDLLVDTLVRSGAEYCAGEPGQPTIHEGFSPFLRSALDRLYAEAAGDPVAREHVTAYFKEHADRFRTVYATLPAEHRFEGARLSVDTPADIAFIEEVYARLGTEAGEASLTEVVRLLKKHPELLEINQHVYQKRATDITRRVLIRCDGGRRAGMGHVVRCCALAEELREGRGCGVQFALAEDEFGLEYVTAAGFPAELMPADADEASWLDALIETTRADVLVFDVRAGLHREALERWRAGGRTIVVIDDPGDRRLAADFAVYPPVPQVQELDWTDFSGTMLVGWEWVILRRDYAEAEPRRGAPVPVVLVAMGGSDPANLTVKAVRALDAIQDDFVTTVVIGTAYEHRAELDAVVGSARRQVEVLAGVEDMAQLMAAADIALASFGMTAYELAASGVPAILMCLTEDHARSATAFIESGIAYRADQHTNVTVDRLAAWSQELLDDLDLRRSISRRGRTLVDGKGAGRVAEVILQRKESTSV